MPKFHLRIPLDSPPSKLPKMTANLIKIKHKIAQNSSLISSIQHVLESSSMPSQYATSPQLATSTNTHHWVIKTIGYHSKTTLIGGYPMCIPTPFCLFHRTTMVCMLLNVLWHCDVDQRIYSSKPACLHRNLVYPKLEIHHTCVLAQQQCVESPAHIACACLSTHNHWSYVSNV